MLGVNRRFRLFRYGQGCVYRPHVDGSWPGSGLVDGRYERDAFQGGRWSKLTFLVYLNDAFSGGNTTFFELGGGAVEARAVVPRAGTVLCFPHGDDRSSPVHEGELVEEGTKYVIRSDVLFASRGKRDQQPARA